MLKCDFNYYYLKPFNYLQKRAKFCLRMSSSKCVYKPQTHTHTHTHIYIYIYIYMYVCMYKYCL